MENDPYLEKNASKIPALELCKAMGYRYLSPADCAAQRGGTYRVILRDILRGQLRRLNRYSYAGAENEFSSPNIERAIEDLDAPLSDGLIGANEKIYDSLLLGRSYPEIVGAGRSLSFNLRYIDWEHPENNLFHVTEEFSVSSQDGQHDARPDIVLFINGVPFAVMECKAPTVPVSAAVRQMEGNQTADYIPQLFKFAQILIASNMNEVRYATAGTPERFWNVWKEQDETFSKTYPAQLISGRMVTEQDRALISLLTPSRVMELIRYFTLFDGNVKKICRYQQYFAVKEILRTVSRMDENGHRKGGVIWHTQGSGKSLTMVMLANYLLSELSAIHPKVVVVTDRKELDRQITATFTHTRLRPARATSGGHLVKLIASDKADIVTAIINKFTTAEKQEKKNDSQNVFVLVDESHRTNYGLMATRMRLVFPNACYIGFTGTPLMKGEKNTLTKFGGLIHKYTIQDGVNDGAIVPLIYEGRFVEQEADEANIDKWFQAETRRLTPSQRDDLSRRWSAIQRLTSASDRVKRIALDIAKHYREGIQPLKTRAMLAVNYKRDAVRYLECFEAMGDLKCAVVISPPDMREGAGDADESRDAAVTAYWKRMMSEYEDAEQYEEAVKAKFCRGEIDILIVCGKLLTGFDAPVCQVLYIDKELKEHGLLQAIARTNRLYDGKEYGLIVDYRGLIRKLDDAMELYSGAGLEKYDGGDLKGVAVDVITAVGNVRSAWSNLTGLFPPSLNMGDAEAVQQFLADEPRRKRFYNLLCAFGRAFHIVLISERAYAALTKDELRRYQEGFLRFSKLRRALKLIHGEMIDNAEYEPIMQNLLDTWLSVKDLRPITNPVDILNREGFQAELNALESPRSKADAISNRLTKSVSEKYDENPAFYESFSKRIRETLDLYKARVISDAEYLDRMRRIMEDYRAGRTSVTFPKVLRNNVHAQAFYGVLTPIFAEAEASLSADAIAEIALDITAIMEKHSRVDWTNNVTIHDRIAQDIDDLFYAYEKERGLKLSFDTIDKVMENVKTVAMRRF